MAKYRVVKQLLPKGQIGDPEWATRTNAYTAVISGSGDQLWEFKEERDAWMKMVELSGSDSSGRLYDVVEVPE
mgnify:FL=1|tara:strand:- start:309 stop:527 length:219 start_codon:yes stop_codon:yes gene_type:complete